MCDTLKQRSILLFYKIDENVTPGKQTMHSCQFIEDSEMFTTPHLTKTVTLHNTLVYNPCRSHYK